VRAVEQQGELVAAQSRQGVAQSTRLDEALGNGLEQLVARVVAETVVHLLEAVQIDEQHRERGARAGRAGERLLQAIAEERAVRQHREAVVERLPRQLLLEAHPLGDVSGIQDDAADTPVGTEIGDVRFEVAPLAETVPDAEDGLGLLGVHAGGPKRGQIVGVDERAEFAS
jgi:hypothetical protein